MFITHILVSEINSNTDMYLNEEIAVVEANQMDINTYGYDKVVSIISEPNNIGSITENSKDLLLGKWIDYIEKSY